LEVTQVFDHRHYVPILRWRPAERGALAKLGWAAESRITPLVELVPRAFHPSDARPDLSVKDVLGRIANDVLENWGQSPLFVDLGLLPASMRTRNGEHPLMALRDEAWRQQLTLVPVTGLDRGQEYQAAAQAMASESGCGLMVRLRCSDIRSIPSAGDLLQLVRHLGVPPKSVDLLVDLGVSASSEVSIRKLCSALPHVHSWRSFTVASGAFPRDLSGLEKNRQHTLRRTDWVLWRDQVCEPADLMRIPTYCDYTIQHPVYYEYDHPGPPNISASIRYTCDEYWLVMRGEGLRNPGGHGYVQYAANAALLCDRDEFCGAQFSYGDDYISEVAGRLGKRGTASYGSPMTWLRAGINHHIAFVVRQIATLFGSPDDSGRMP
jgi:hypothetical protein